MSDGTLAEEIERMAAGESIEAAVLGKLGGRYGYSDDDPRSVAAASVVGQVLTWDQARPLLNYQWDASFGGADCHAFYAWTASRVLFVHEYDGSTTVVYVPRNPVSGEADLSGAE